MVRAGREASVPFEQVVPGDLVVIRSGERIPVDGVIRHGASTVDGSLLNGEYAPV